jgi:SWI/SNF-related matrix-associated actin-dependent regulator of chromatin subfamily A member 5
LLTTVAREFEDAAAPKGANGAANGKGKREPEDDENDEDSVLGMAPAKKKSKNGVKVCSMAYSTPTLLIVPQNKALDNVKSAAGSKATSAGPSSRASSVMSTASSPAAAPASKSKGKGKKK